jgi:serine/threonine-protein kinase
MNATARSTPLVPGFCLDRYELLALIAEGGFGQVWLARLRGKRGFEKLVAIKVPRLTGEVNFQEMLLDEAQIASQIDHENVVRILELGEQDEILYIVMEWIDGEPLSSLLRTLEKKKIALPLSIALRIMSETCAAAHAAHELRGPDGQELGVVHRDISPQNILIARPGRVKLIDFGIVKARDRASGETTEGTLKGKIRYMAPEQALGGTIDRRTDVFALGAVLYRLIAGRAPYEADNDVATLQRLSGDTRVAMPDVPEEIRSILEKALERSVAFRFRTAAEMEQALASAITSLNLQCEPSDVAAFVHEQLHDKIEKRQQAIEQALKAAAERSAIQSRRTLVAASETVTDAPLEVSSQMHPSLLVRRRWVVWGVAFGLGLLAASIVIFALRSSLQRETRSNEATEIRAAASSAAPAVSAPAPAASPEGPVLEIIDAVSEPAPTAASPRVSPPRGTPSPRPSTPPSAAKAPAGPTPPKPGNVDFGY